MADENETPQVETAPQKRARRQPKPLLQRKRLLPPKPGVPRAIARRAVARAVRVADAVAAVAAAIVVAAVAVVTTVVAAVAATTTVARS